MKTYDSITGVEEVKVERSSVPAVNKYESESGSQIPRLFRQAPNAHSPLVCFGGLYHCLR